MGAEDWPSAVQRRDRLVHGFEQAARCSRPKSRARRDESKRLRMAGGMCAKSRVSQRIKLAGLHIGLELTIPGRSVKRRIPSAKCRKFLGGKLLNLLFDRFDVAHASACRSPHENESGVSSCASASSVRRRHENHLHLPAADGFGGLAMEQ